MDNQERLADAQRRLAEAMLARDYIESGDSFIRKYIDNRVSLLLNKITANTPVDDRTYLAAHGGIVELKNIDANAQMLARQIPTIEEEINALRQDGSA